MVENNIFEHSSEKESSESGEQEPKQDEVCEKEPLSEAQRLEEEIDSLRAESEERLDKHRRTLAEFANYRKRQDRERELQRTRVIMDVLQKILPILDDFELAIRDIPAEGHDSGWVDGILLIERKLREMLREFEVTPIEAVGDEFDPNYHSALFQEESDEYPAGIVMEELRKGYLVSDRVLRPSLVKVSAGINEDKSGGAGKEDAISQKTSPEEYTTDEQEVNDK